MTEKWGKIQGKSDLVRVERSSCRDSTVYTFMSSVIHMAFLKVFVGTQRRGRQRLDKSILWTLL